MGKIQLIIDTMQSYTIVRSVDSVSFTVLILAPSEMEQLSKLMKEAGF